MVCSPPAEPLWMNFGDGSLLKKCHELVHLNKENGYNHLVYALDNGFYTPFWFLESMVISKSTWVIMHTYYTQKMGISCKYVINILSNCNLLLSSISISSIRWLAYVALWGVLLFQMDHCIVALGLTVMEQMYYYLFYFIEIIFEFSIEYRVYDSGSKLFLGAWSLINSISLRGMSVMCTKFGNKVSHTSQPPQFLEAHFTPSSYHGFVSNYNNGKVGIYCILWYQLLGIKLVWKFWQNAHFLVLVLKLSL